MIDTSDECASIINSIKSKFTRNNRGMIVDDFGNRWLLWDAERLSLWWRKLGDLTDKPLGRKIAFAALECEKSMLLEQVPNYLFRRNHRSWKFIARRWSEMGWGRFQVSGNRIIVENSANDALSSGMICAAAESIHSHSFRLRWEGDGSNLVQVILSKDSRNIPNPAPLQSVQSGNSSFLLEISKVFGGMLEVEGNRVLLLPFELFNELGKSSDCLDQQSKAMFEVVKSLDEQIIFADEWDLIFEEFLHPMGLIAPVSHKQNGLVSTFDLPDNEYLAEGVLLACWERIFGRVSTSIRDNFGNFIIKPKHEIASD